MRRGVRPPITANRRSGSAGRLDDNRLDLGRADVFHSVGPRLVPDRVAVRDIHILRGPIGQMDPRLPALEEVGRHFAVRMLGVRLSWRQTHPDDPNLLILEQQFVVFRCDFRGMTSCVAIVRRDVPPRPPYLSICGVRHRAASDSRSCP